MFFGSTIAGMVFSLSSTLAASSGVTPCEAALIEVTLPTIEYQSSLHLVPNENHDLAETLWGMLAEGVRATVATREDPPMYEIKPGVTTIQELLPAFEQKLSQMLTEKLKGQVTVLPFGVIVTRDDGTILRVSSRNAAYEQQHYYDNFLSGSSIPDVARGHLWSLLAHALRAAKADSTGTIGAPFHIELGKTKLTEALKPFEHFFGNQGARIIQELQDQLRYQNNVFPFGKLELDSDGTIWAYEAN